MNNQTLIDNLRCIPDFPQKGINFRDVTTLFQSAECMKIMVDELYEIYKDRHYKDRRHRESWIRVRCCPRQ